MSDNDHEHRAYQVWDGNNQWVSLAEFRQLERRVADLERALERAVADLERSQADV